MTKSIIVGGKCSLYWDLRFSGLFRMFCGQTSIRNRGATRGGVPPPAESKERKNGENQYHRNKKTNRVCFRVLNDSNDDIFLSLIPT